MDQLAAAFGRCIGPQDRGQRVDAIGAGTQGHPGIAGLHCGNEGPGLGCKRTFLDFGLPHDLIVFHYSIRIPLDQGIVADDHKFAPGIPRIGEHAGGAGIGGEAAGEAVVDIVDMGQVHRLDAFLGSGVDVKGGNGGDISQKVAQQIHPVDGIFYKGATAELVAAGPVAQRLAAVEGLQQGVARAPLCQQLAQRLYGWFVAVHKTNLGHDAGFLHRIVEAHGLGQIHALGLFDKDGNAFVGGDEHLVGVQGRGDTKVNGVELLAFE